MTIAKLVHDNDNDDDDKCDDDGEEDDNDGDQRSFLRFLSEIKLSIRRKFPPKCCIRKMDMRDSRGLIGLTEDQTPSPSEWKLSRDARLNFNLRSPTQRL